MAPAPLHVLIVDDAPEDRLTVRRLLTRTTPGIYTFTEVARGDHVLAACAATPPDCVLLDQCLPDQDGLVVLAALRAQSDVPVVLLTGLGSETLAVAALQQGAQDYLVKGMLTPERLRLTIEHAMAVVQFTRERDRTMALLTTVLDTLPTGVVVLDAALHILRVNHTLTVLFDRPATALYGQPLAALNPTLAASLAAPCAQVLATGEPSGPFEVVTTSSADGALPRIWQISLRPLTLPTTGTAGLCLVIHEVTAQHQANAALQANEQRLRLALDAAKLVAWEWDVAAGTFTYATEETTYFRLPPGQRSRTVAEQHATIHPSDLPAYTAMVAAALERGDPYQIQMRVSAPDGQLHWLEIHGLVQHAAKGQPVRVIGVTRDISARKQLQANMQAAQQTAAATLAQLEAIIASTPNGIGYLDHDLRYRMVNPALAALNGRTPADYLGHSLTEMVPSLATWLEPSLRQVLATGAPMRDQEWQGPPNARDEVVHSWLYSLYPVTGPTGGIAGVGVTISDLTPIRRTEAALRASEARYRTLFEMMSQGVVYQDATGQIIAANPAAERILGLSMSQLQGRSSLDPRWHAIHEDGTPFLGETHPAMVALRTGQTVRDVVMGVYNPATDTCGWISICAEPQFQPGATMPTQVYATFDDITERRQAQHELERQRKQLDAIVQTMHEGVVAFHPDGTIALVNTAGVRLTGLAHADPPLTLAAVAQTIGLILLDAHGQTLAPDDEPVRRVLRGEQFAGLEICLRLTGHAAEHWLAFSGTPVYDEQGTLYLGVITAQDITQRKHDEAALQAHAEALSRTNAELTRALQLKDEFLTMMSHELRAPLNAVLGFTEALAEELYGPIGERQRNALATVTQSGRHLLAMLSGILDMAHIDAGKETLDRQSLDVEIVCRAAMQFVQATAQQKGIRLLRSVEQGVEGLRADERRLTQILVNLLENAVKFTPVGGTVGLEVLADNEQEHIQFSVWDTGIGIAEADYIRLFQPFTQVDGRLARQYGGVGLGLSLVRRLVDLHGGSISLASTPGQGSRFTVSLPWAVADNVTLREAPTSVPRPHAWVRPPHILIADHHELSLSLYHDVLIQQGCRVTIARTEDEVVTQGRMTNPDVVLVAIQLPGMDRIGVLHRLRADSTIARVPIIVMTGLELPGDRERCLAAGASSYLVKPVGLHTLVATVAAVLPALSIGRTLVEV